MYVCIPHDFPTGGTDFVPTGRLPRSAREIKGDELTLGVSCENKYRCDDIIKNKHQVFLLCFLAWSLNAKACLQLTFGRTPKPNERKFHICSIPRIYIYMATTEKSDVEPATFEAHTKLDPSKIRKSYNWIRGTFAGKPFCMKMSLFSSWKHEFHVDLPKKINSLKTMICTTETVEFPFD